MICKVPRCEYRSTTFVRGWCISHYLHGRRDGTIPLVRDGSGWDDGHGYRAVVADGRETRAHRVVAERALGRPLRRPEEVHHVDANKLNNDGPNLVICPDRAYHMLLHRRTRALDACGHAGWLKCGYCKRYDAPENIWGGHKGVTPRHAVCSAAYRRARA